MSKIWTCKIGEVATIPPGADGPMREAVSEAYHAITGTWPEFLFSGWGGELTDLERAVADDDDDAAIEAAERKDGGGG